MSVMNITARLSTAEGSLNGWSSNAHCALLFPMLPGRLAGQLEDLFDDHATYLSSTTLSLVPPIIADKH